MDTIIDWVGFIIQWTVVIGFTGFVGLMLWACTVPFTYRTTDEDRRRHLEQIGRGREQ